MRKLTDEEFKASMEKASQAVDQGARLKFRFVMEQREEILTAFIAKYGFEPDKCTQTEYTTADGKRGWCVRGVDSFLIVNLRNELCNWLDQQKITSENIGEIRSWLLFPWSSKWNAIVRDETADRENKR